MIVQYENSNLISPDRVEEIIAFIEKEFHNRLYSNITNDNTKESYMRSGKEFLCFLKAKGFSQTTMEDYAKHIDEMPIMRNTKASKFTGAKIVLKRVAKLAPQLIPTSAITYLIADANYLTSTTGHVKQGPSTNDVDKVSSYIEGLKEGKLKDILECQFHLFRWQGLRTSEAIGIRISDIDFEKSVVMIKRKNGKEKTPTFMLTCVSNALRKYINKQNISDQLFTEVRNSTWRRWKKVFKLSGANPDNCTHGFRHFVCTSIMDEGGSLELSSHMLAHTNITTTQKNYLDPWGKLKMLKEYDQRVMQSV